MDNSNSNSKTQNNQKESQPESPNVKLFRNIQSIFMILGIKPISIEQSYPFNRRIFLGFILTSCGITFILVFVSNEANTFWEYTQSAYFFSAAIIATFILTHVVFRTSKIFEFITNFENVINTSELE